MKHLLLTTIAAVLFVGCSSFNHSVLVASFQMLTRGICAHRGVSDSHPENTIAAFREAIRLGAHMIELDVALSSDGKLVLMHDHTVDRTTDGSGRVEELTLADLKKLDAGFWKDSRFKGEQIPTLKEALDIMPYNIWLNIHLKGGVDLAEKTTRLIASENRLHQAFLACSASAATAARRVESHIKICNMDRQANNLKYVNETIQFRCEFIQLLGGISVDPMHTRRLREHNSRVNYCCANDPAKVERLFEEGVEFPLVDRVSEMLEVADKKGIPRLKPSYRQISANTAAKLGKN